MPNLSRTDLQLTVRNNSGPYEAIVRSVMDPKFQGALKVEILKTTQSGQTQTTGQTVRAKFLNPFYGTTPVKDIRDNKDYRYSQSSYGMWFVPPDIGNRVMVIFVEGNIEKAYWFGCIQQEGMNIQLPEGNPATNLHNSTEAGEIDKKMPVVEYNKEYNKNNPKKDANNYLKPVHNTFKNILANQGLIEDETRGLSSSSARREVPSSVFGILTPGPIDKDFDETFKPSKNLHFQRKGGSSFIMDDGDQTLIRKGSASSTSYEYVDVSKKEVGGQPGIPFNELLRLRTRTGHQILMHNSEDLIYIGNAKGTTWIEMTANGKLDIFADDSVSIHSKGDFNFKTDRDFNLEANRNINLKASTLNTEVATENLKVTGSQTNQIGATQNTTVGATSNLYAGVNVNIDVGGLVNIANGVFAGLPVTDLSVFTNPGESTDSILKRIPQHEPWGHHENLNPTNVSKTYTDRSSDFIFEETGTTSIPPSTATTTRDPFYMSVYADPEGRVVGDF